MRAIILLEGIVEKDEGTIKTNITRKEGSVIERMVSDKGQMAVSYYKVVKRLKDKDLTVVEYELETGRTHQLRLHSKHINHPILGDSLYNKESSLIKRQALHSIEVKFIHPITKTEMIIKSDIPQDMKKIIND